jgi:hypothetical protein
MTTDGWSIMFSPNTAITTLEQRLRKLLEDHEYISLNGTGLKQKLTPHHIGALMDDLLPFIHKELSNP